MAERFHDPHIGLGRIYTRKGDDGTTSLVGGQRIAKDDPRIEAYGTVDELNAVVGLVRVELEAAGLAPLAATILGIQHTLFNLGSALSTLPGELAEGQPRVTGADAEALEAEIDRCNEDLPPLRSFVLPGADRLDGLWHLARTVCRRAERAAARLHRDGGCSDDDVRYLNRLSDACFVWGRWSLMQRKGTEVLWDPNRA